jgi:3-phenylpropionate/cinnamic acid dioxygenase small subunit
VVTETMQDVELRPRLRRDHPDHIDAHMFLDEEAELLDDHDLATWMTLLSPELTYVMPVQPTRSSGRPQPGETRGYLVHEDIRSLGLRVHRLLNSESVWAENPPSRTRRFVSNVRVRPADDGMLHVRSYQLLLRSRGDATEMDLISSERDDVLERGDDGRLRLRSRTVTVDQARLGARGLPVPL